MKKSKKTLSLNKLVISKLNNPSIIMSGDTEASDDPNCPSISLILPGCPIRASIRDFKCKSNNDLNVMKLLHLAYASSKIE